MSPSHRTTRAALATIGLLAAGLAAGPLAAPAAHAAKGGTCAPFTLTTGGRTYSGDQRITIPAASVGATMTVRGKYVRFGVRSASFAVTNYTLTGTNSPRPDRDLPLDAPTVVFTSKVPNHGATLTSGVSLRLDPDGLEIQRSGAGQDMKIQAKNCAQGGLFQMEPEPGTTFTHRLGPDFTYTRAGPEGRLCISNGDFSAYESPELATRLAPASGAGTSSRWQVASGGRMGFVVGEDAVEGGCLP